MEKVFNKLVRDKIPEIIGNNNEVAEIRILDNKEYLESLKKKLLEEYNEVINADSENILEELADMLEVIDALSKTYGTSLDEIIKIKEVKKEKRGGFDKKILLIKTINK